MVEQCTYDGTIHSAEMILKRIGHLCDYILFDEAWAGFMKFHPLYAGRFAMGLHGPRPRRAGHHRDPVDAQAAGELLAGLADPHRRIATSRGQKRRVEHRRFNESFMQHASTSPFYPLFASLDVGAQMMKGRSGEVLWDDTIRLGIELRKKIRAVRREFEEKETRPERRWFFEPFVPDRVVIPDVSREGAVHDVAWETIAHRPARHQPGLLAARAGRRLARLPGIEPGFAMTDPNKLTLLTPGFDRATGGYAEHGIPAPVVAQYLRENRIVAGEERPQLAAVPADARRRGQQGRHADQRPRRLQEAARRQCAAGRGHSRVLPAPDRRAMPACACAISAPTCTASSARPMSARCRAKQFSPSTCRRSRCRRATRRAAWCATTSTICRSTPSRGRIATTPFVVYPPGIATIVPGERLTERAQPMIDYLKMFETCFNTFPGFEVEIQGVYQEIDASGRVRLHTYVVSE